MREEMKEGQMSAGGDALEQTLDPSDWEEFAENAHAALDGMIEYLKGIRNRPVWQKMPDEVRTRFAVSVPEDGAPLQSVLDEFWRDVLPYGTGNIHPRFWSWVAGNGSPVGILADMLAAGMNLPGLGFDDSAASRVEIQVIDWFKELFDFPSESSGLLVSGGSMANLVGLAVARTSRSDYDVRKEGVSAPGHPPLAMYASTETHSSIQRAVELLGLGNASLRLIPVTGEFEIDMDALSIAMDADSAAGIRPAVLVGNAGTVNTGAIDPLEHLARLARSRGLWFHVDGAFGAMAALTSNPPANLAGLREADSFAFDLHKWLHQPYNVGAVLVRHPQAHLDTFQIAPAYLDRLPDGVASGPINFNALGVQLSRSFAALRPWLTFKTYGVKLFRELIEQNIKQAQYLEKKIRDSAQLEILAPTALNVVNFRYNPGGLDDDLLDEINKEVLLQLQKQGVAAPSSTRINDRFSLRVCITNHRSRAADFDLLLSEVLRLGDQVCTFSALTRRR